MDHAGAGAIRALEVVERWYEALGQDDLSDAVELTAVDIEIRYPGVGVVPYAGAWKGHDGFTRWAEAHDEAEETLDFRVEATISDGDRVVVLGQFEARARDTGRQWRTRFAHALTVRDDRVARLDAYFDTAAALEAHRA